MSNEHVIFWQSTKTDPNKLIAPYFKLMTTGTGFVVHKNLLQTRANCMICVLYFLQELSFLLHLFHTSQYSYLKLIFFLLYSLYILQYQNIFMCINTPITLPVFIMLRLCDTLPDFLNFYIHDKNLFMVILLDVVTSWLI